MKILIAIGVLRKREAGAAGVVFNHAEELQKLGHQVDCWFFDDVLPQPRWPARFRDMEFASAISSRIRRQPRQYDVVNLHAPWGCVFGLSRKWFPSTEFPPYVFTMQGSEERYARAMKLEQKKGRATNFAWKNRVWHRLYHQSMYDFSISTANFGVVANREGWILSELKYGHPPGRIWYVPNGVNENFFQPREFSNIAANRLLYVGTWLDRKGIYYLADAFTALAARSPELQLTVAGCIIPEEQVKAHFPAGIRNRISVLPFLGRDAMPQLYASHDIFVFPSLMEGMPLTLLEAMAAAMPVVTTNTCGMADLIENERNGLLVPAADAPTLGAAIERLQNDANLRRNLGLCAQKDARRFTWDLIARQLEQVFQLAVESRRQEVSL
ncbi:MAG TPA: glycosyltransferase family 4 protein [Candidatus Sulfotelmatobacter sp.]|nr:glycosyltransferase family 4 protein [Candidatus Sulfotelmatobacter sp.]